MPMTCCIDALLICSFALEFAHDLRIAVPMHLPITAGEYMPTPAAFQEDSNRSHQSAQWHSHSQWFAICGCLQPMATSKSRHGGVSGIRESCLCR